MTNQPSSASITRTVGKPTANGNGHKPPASGAPALAPHSEDMEKALIAAALLYPPGLDEIDPPLAASDFMIAGNAQLWQAIQQVHSSGAYLDAVSVANALPAAQRDYLGGDYLTLITMNFTGQSYNVAYYAEQVRQYARRRALLGAASELARLAHDDTLAADALEGAVSRAVSAALGELTSENEGVVDFADAVSELYDDFEAYRDGRKELGIPTGFPELDRYMLGLVPGELILVAARPGMGKSTLLLQWATHAARRGKRVLYLSMEMVPKENVKRVVAQECGINTAAMHAMTDQQWAAFVAWAKDPANTARSIRFDARTMQTPSRIATRARREQRRYGLDVLFVDYIQLMSDDQRSDSQVQELTHISRAMKTLAGELNIPVVAAAQMNRGVEHEKRRPRKDDLRGSGTLEQDADKILFLYDPNATSDDAKSGEPRIIEAILEKHRNGPTCKVDWLWQPDKIRFGEVYKGDENERLKKVVNAAATRRGGTEGTGHNDPE